jgi:hypothetical protein
MSIVEDRMPVAQRYAVYAVFGALWLSGCLWLLLHEYFAKPDEFGAARAPFEPTALLVHGVLALVATYLLGWIAARHVAQAWRDGRRRASGGAYSACVAALVLSGFALFFVSDDRWQHLCALAHDVLGLAFTVFAAQHWFFGPKAQAAQPR